MEKNKIVIILSILFLCIIIHSSYGQGSRYTGEYKKSATLQYVNKKNFVIEGLEFTDVDSINFKGRGITLWSCENVIIRNCKFKNIPWNTAIYTENSTNITIIDCEFEDVYMAFKADNCKGRVKFENNDIKNLVKGLHTNNAGGGVQFLTCIGPDNSVSYNAFENLPEKTNTIDVIGMFNTNGTPNSPIIIKGNWIRGGGPHGSSGGILLGDWGGSFQIAEDNILVDPGQYGIGIAGGHNMTLRNNKVYAKQQPFTNVGLVVANWTQQQQGASYNIVVENNAINWTDKNGSYGTAWFSENMRVVVPDWRNSMVRDPNILSTILPTEILGRVRGLSKINNDNEIPSDETVLSPDINIYKDKFGRICTNCKGTISLSASISVSQENGQKILNIPVMGYHTAIDDKLPSGTYNVKVKNGDKLQLKQIIVE